MPRSKDRAAVLMIPIIFISAISINCWLRAIALAQTSCRRVDRAADGFPGYEKFHSPVLLPVAGLCHPDCEFHGQAFF
jgi:hypothetical protein